MLRPGAILAALWLAAPVGAQQVDPALGVEITGVLPSGAVVVRNGGRDFVCDLDVAPEDARLVTCRPVRLDTEAGEGAREAGGDGLGPEDAGEILASMSDAAWEQLVREIFAGAGCRIDIVGGESRVISLAGTAIGISEEAIARLSDELFIRADRAIVGLTSRGALGVEDGALVLEDCP